MRLNNRMLVVLAAASLGLAIPAMAQGHSGGHPGGMGGPTGGGMGGGMGNSGMGSAGQMGSAGRTGQPGQMGQSGQMGTPSGRKTVSDLLTHNTKLSSNLQSILGSGVNLQDASSGFKTLGQFVAATHVSKNLGIPFSSLKSTMQSDGWNLGKAIHTLQPSLSKSEVKSAVGTAQREAKADIKNSHAK